MRGDLFGLFFDLVECLHDGGAANGQRARTIRAHAKGNAAGVAVNHFDVVAGDPETTGKRLGKRRFMALAVAVGTYKYGDRAGGVEGNIAPSVEIGIATR